MRIKKRGKYIDIGNIKKVNELGKIIGLMFSRREKARILLFEFKRFTKMKLHSWFVFFPFIAIWLDKENNIISIKKVKPFTFGVSIEKPFFKLVEIPMNEKNKRLVEISRR